MSRTPASSIYTGPWVNWSHGLVLGSTITLSQRDGELLTAFLAIFVTAAGSACWKILSYILHQNRASQEYQDGLHHQEQAILRNADGPASASWELAKSAWYWRKIAVNPLIRTLPAICLALLNLALFGVAGIFSSEVTKAAGNETLILSHTCGRLNATMGSTPTQVNEANFGLLEVNDTLTATTYSRACYGNIENNLQCNQYARQSLHWQTNQNASCPFTSDLCWYGGTAAYEMDSGRLDSHDDIGINAPKSHRVQYRKVTTCSPIHTKSYANEFNDTNPNHLNIYGDTLVQYMYGGVGGGLTNYTFQYDIQVGAMTDGYTLSSYIAYAAQNDSEGWTPIPALGRTDADVSIFFVAPNSVMYQTANTDPVYAATIPESFPNGDGTNATYYTPDRLVSVIACTDQHQICNPRTDKCTPLTTSGVLLHSNNPFGELGLNSAQYTTALHFESLFQDLSAYSSVHSRGANALRASETLYNNNFQTQIPVTQWMLEVSSWYAVSMAKLQQKILQYATGPAYIPEGYDLVAPMNKYEEQICKNQKIRSSTGTISFSVLGVGIILLVGSLLVVTQLLLESIMGFIRAKMHWKEYKSLQWAVDDKLQMQRLAYEESGQGQWSGGADSVPVIWNNDKIGVPMNNDMAHPRLSRARNASISYDPRAPEAEGLMNKVDTTYKVEAAPMWES